MTLATEIDDGAAVVTIDHPPSNLLDGELFLALLEALDALEADGDVRVLLVRSADPDFFVMHGDVEMLKDLTPPYAETTEANG